MDYTQILKRAWELVKGYRALWVFGAILALTTFSLESAMLLRSDDDHDDSRQGITITTRSNETFLEAVDRSVRDAVDEFRQEIDKADREVEEFFSAEFDLDVESDILALILTLGGILLIGFVVAKAAGYVSQAALIRMVNETEESGTQLTVRQGWRRGWSRTALRLFLIDLLVDTSIVLVFVLLFALILAPLALWFTGNTAAGAIGTVFTVALFFPGLALCIVALLALSLFKQFIGRACVLDGLGVAASIRRGFQLTKRNLGRVLPVWLVDVGVNLVWSIAITPVVAVLAVAGLVLGVAGALAVGSLSILAFDGSALWLAAGAVGIPLFLLTLAIPLACLGGFREVFLSSMWTLTYRQLHAVEQVARGSVAKVDAPNLDAAPA
jgi:hypothetical protein